MTKIWIVLPLLAALTACGDGPQAVSAEVTVEPNSALLELACKASTTGSCHAVVFGATTAFGSAKVGEKTSIEGVIPGARFCVSATEPDPAKCHRREIGEGTQIVREEKVARG